MRAEIITIGDELCRGEIVNTNASWLAGALWDMQITVTHLHSCRDLAEDMAAIIRQAAGRSDLVLLSGGLGPTLDDLTVDLVSELACAEAVVDEESAERMRTRFAGAGVPLVANAERQVRVPKGARVYANSAGLAPGFEVQLGSAQLIAMPGPPRELKAIFNDHLRDRIGELRLARGEKIEYVARRILRVFGKGESHIATALEGLEIGQGESLHYQVKPPETLVKLVVRGASCELAAGQLKTMETGIRERLGSLVYGVDDDSLPAALLRDLQAAGHTISTAESCTGGLISGLLTDLPGVSRNFTGGAVTYSNAEKARQLGVSTATLEEHGAVSEPVVDEMARGVRERFGTDWGVAVSGVAGPGGGTEDKPVGTVWIAVAGPGDEVKTKRYCWPGARDQVRSLAAYWALNLVRRQLGKF
ncbi:MAG: competence/damage-inducible protein A [Myxococcales bacterium]|nr:competence/damage-inducible protein A [Myxococcales bacterium]